MSETVRTSGNVTGARVCAIIAFVLAGIAVFLFPIILGPAAIILGIVSMAMGDKVLGKWAIAAGVAGTALGMFLGYLAVS
jgi:hypothetical protein